MIVTDGLHRLYAWVHSERHLYPTKLSFTSLQVSKLTTSDDAKLLLSGTKPCRSWPIHVNAIAKRAIGQPHLCAEPLRYLSCNRWLQSSLTPNDWHLHTSSAVPPAAHSVPTRCPTRRKRDLSRITSPPLRRSSVPAKHLRA